MNTNSTFLSTWFVPTAFAISSFSASANGDSNSGSFDIACNNAKTSANCVNQVIKANNIDNLIFCRMTDDNDKLDLPNLWKTLSSAKLLPDGSEEKPWQSAWVKDIVGCIDNTAANNSLNQSDVDFKAELTAYSKTLADSGTSGNPEKPSEDGILSRWSTNLIVGAMQMSDYDDQGNSLGLTETEFMAQLDFNYADFVGTETLFAADFRVLFSGAGSIKDVPPDPKPDPANNNQGNTLRPGSFNDVNDNLEFTAKFTWSFDEAANDDGFISAGIIAGVYNRKTESQNKSSIDLFAGPIIEYKVFDDNIRTSKKTHPRGRISLAPVWYEEYAQRSDELRWILEAEYRIWDASNFTIGLRSNIGAGVDEFGIFAGWDMPLKKFEAFLKP